MNLVLLLSVLGQMSVTASGRQGWTVENYTSDEALLTEIFAKRNGTNYIYIPPMQHKDMYE